jgi:2-keto-4-pentenoate hydratase/2-oxohepta-3-ene-1,7-dioic acid hydratase in catechol pathway
MRLATYRGPDGSPRSGVILGQDGQERVVDLAQESGGRIERGDLLSLLEAGPDALDAAQAVAASGATGQALGPVELLAPMARPPKLIAAAGNYQAHVAESRAVPVDSATMVPKLFIKPSSSVLAPNVAVPLPTFSSKFDWELELAVVIGRGGRDIPVERALDHVAGYTVINDLSARAMDWGLPGRQPSDRDLWFDWLNGKWGDGFAPIGPWLVTADEIPDPQALRMRLSVNGTVHQDATTADMIYSCAELMNMNEITGGSPYRASTLASADGRSRSVSGNELRIARFQGRHVAQITKALVAGRQAIG